MQITLEQISPVLVELSVQIDAERVTQEYEKTFGAIQKRSRIKGFRPGKAPKDIVRRVYGGRVDADVIQRLVDETFPQAAAEKQMQPVTTPSVEPSELVTGKPFSYKARVEVLPAIASVTYEGLEAKRPKIEIKDDEVESELDAIRRANSTLESPASPRPAREGDVVTCDLTVSVGGVVIEDAGATSLAIELGLGQVFKEIEQALTGAKVGDTVTAEVDMAATHQHKKLAGQRVTFTIKASELKERVLPPADDELAKDLGDFETLEQLRTSLKEQLGAREKERTENVLAERLVQALVDANPVPVPPSLVSQQMRASEAEIVYRARMQGQNVTGVGDALREQLQKDSETKVRAGLIMAEIAKKEGLQIGNAEIEEGLKELSEQTGKSVPKLRAEYADAKKREMLVGMILENKVLDIIEAKAKIVEE
jgi:trigger factor